MALTVVAHLKFAGYINDWLLQKSPSPMSITYEWHGYLNIE